MALFLGGGVHSLISSSFWCVFNHCLRLRQKHYELPSLTQLGWPVGGGGGGGCWTHDLQITTIHFISCHWDTCSNHSSISDFYKKEMHCYIILEVWGDFKCTGSQTDALAIDFFVQVQLRQKQYAPHIWFDWGSNSWPPDHDSTFHATETPALTTQPSVTIFSSPGN